MRIEEEVRSRRLGALLEEAIQGGPAPGLEQRIAKRVAAEPTHQRWPHSLTAAAVVLVGVGVVAAVVGLQGRRQAERPSISPGFATQDPAQADEAVQGGSAVRLRVHAAKVRLPAALPLGPRWTVDGVACGDTPALRGALRGALRTALERAAAPAKQQSGASAQRPLQIEPDQLVSWGAVLAATDLALDEGFAEIRYRGVAACRMLRRGVTMPPGPADSKDEPGRPSLAETRYQVPGSSLSKPRAAIDVLDDGRIVESGEVLFRAPITGEAGSERLRHRLASLAAALREEGEIELPSQRKVVAAPLLLRIDSQALWGSVRRVLDEALDPKVGFFVVEFAVAAKKAKKGAPDAAAVKAEARSGK